VQAVKLIDPKRPDYPPLARAARIQGTVTFKAIIAKNGTIQNLQLIGGHPLLVPAAQKAVQSYLYTPTILEGQAVEVSTMIDVNFMLSR